MEHKKDDGFSSKNLGRKYVKDDRDKTYLIENLLKSAPKTEITSKYWDDNGWWGNQGNTPQCVGYAWAHWIEDGPVKHGGIPPIVNPTTNNIMPNNNIFKYVFITINNDFPLIICFFYRLNQ